MSRVTFKLVLFKSFKRFMNQIIYKKSLRNAFHAFP